MFQVKNIVFLWCILSTIFFNSIVEALPEPISIDKFIPLPKPISIFDTLTKTNDIRPYQVSVLVESEGHLPKICSGVIIKPSSIITSAHCIYEAYAKDITIRAGSSFHNSGGLRADVNNFHIHPLYDHERHEYDIAVLWLKYPLPTGYYGFPVQEIEIAKELPKIGTPLTTSGWNSINRQRLSEHLETVNLLMGNRSDCEMSYRTESMLVPVTSICANWKNYNDNSCYGESGAPLVYNGQLIGLASLAHGCGDPKFPEIFTNVIELRDWVENSTW